MSFQSIFILEICRFLKEIKAYFGGIGRITEGKNNCGYYVSSVEELTTVIIPHFIKYPLITQKFADFLLDLFY